MRDSTRIGLAYAIMNTSQDWWRLRAILRATPACVGAALVVFMAAHLLGDIGARVAAGLDRADAFRVESR